MTTGQIHTYDIPHPTDPAKALIIPAIHLNGTGANLIVQLRAAIDAIATAEDALRQVTPHGRDYYVYTDQYVNVLALARDAHMDRAARLETVREELTAIGQELLLRYPRLSESAHR